VLDAERAYRLLAERRARRDRELRAGDAQRVAEELRAWMYPKQRAFFTSPSKLRASRKTRRSGATTGGCRELLARALVIPKFRATYIGETRIEAKDRAWRSDTQGGLVDLLEQYGRDLNSTGVAVYELGGIEFEVREQELAIKTSTGGRIELFGADNERAIHKKRGGAKHVYWLDEAQGFRWLERFYKAVAVAAMTDFEGEFWMTGTPSPDCVGMFYDVTRDDGEALTGWEVHEFAAIDNPYFGATPEERWARTAERAREENGWSVDDPDFQREWCGRWVKTDARFVYAVHAVPEHELCYADPRVDDDGFPDLEAAMADLPGRDGPEPREYYLALGADLGTKDDFAVVVWAWSLHDDVLYELASWKKPGLDYDEMAEYLRALCDVANFAIVVADAGGGGKPAVMGWSKKWVDRYGLPITEATKGRSYKPVAIKQVNTDIRRGKLKLRRRSPLHAEMRIHRWAPRKTATAKELEDPTTPNHCCDAALYAHMESYHHRHREMPVAPSPGSPQHVAREEAEHEDVALDGPGWARW
jgi:hypothetical protein